MTINNHVVILSSFFFSPLTLVSSFVPQRTFIQEKVNLSCLVRHSSNVNEQPTINSNSYTTAGNRYSSTTAFDIFSDNDILPAIKAVRKACTVTHHLQEVLCPKSGSLSKDDSSPVTIADYAAQAIVLDNIRTFFPSDSYLAEESSKELLSQIQNENNTKILREIVHAVQSINPCHDVQYVLESIDLGQSYYDDKGNDRLWCLDPIDGTKGFLRGVEHGQYCVALCLIVNGKPEVGILGCPNLHIDKNSDEKGCMFIAKRNEGSYQIPLHLDDDSLTNNDEWIQNIKKIKRLSVTANDESEISMHDSIFCIGVEKYSDPSGQCDAMAKIIHGKDAINEEGSIIKAIKMDSQAKYGLVARGEAQVYLRLPKLDYVEWIWDHAAGSLMIQEAGGKVTDTHGNELDFSLGPKLSPNVEGIIGTNGGLFHDAILNAYHTQRNR